MSDAIKALNEVVSLAGQRDEEDNSDNLDLIDKISVVAGDALEDNIRATYSPRPRKERVYKEIVRRIAEHFCDQCDTQEQAYDNSRNVREILASFDIETVDCTGRPVKIS